MTDSVGSCFQFIRSTKLRWRERQLNYGRALGEFWIQKHTHKMKKKWNETKRIQMKLAVTCLSSQCQVVYKIYEYQSGTNARWNGVYTFVRKYVCSQYKKATLARPGEPTSQPSSLLALLWNHPPALWLVVSAVCSVAGASVQFVSVENEMAVI